MKALTNTELTSFCSQFALILRSGISSLEGLSIMLEDTPKGEGQQILENVLHKMEETGCLFIALQSTGAFPTYLCSMVEIGEHSGRLDDVMESLAEHYRLEESISSGIKSAVTYPLIMLGMMIAVMLVLIIKVLPVFQQVFEQLGANLTGVSGTILNLGNTLEHYSLVFLAFIAVIICVFLVFFFSRSGKKKLSSFSNNFFATKKLSEKIAVSRFASGMYLSLSSGLDVDQSLKMVTRLVEHPMIQAKIKKTQELIAEGENFTDAISKAEIFSGLASSMIAIGFKTGSMDEVMKQISDQYNDEISEQISGIVSRLEPTLVAILSIVVGMILLSVMLPLMGIMSSIG